MSFFPGLLAVVASVAATSAVHSSEASPGSSAPASDVVLPDAASPPPLEEVIVTASLRRDRLADLPASVTVLDAATVAAAGV
jgi:hypothetical protein